jgi:hypothetical protein
MPNSIKYSTTGDTLSLRKGNFYIGTGDVGKGPTSSTGHWNGITPPSGGYTVYKNKVSNGPAIWTATSDNQLISLTNNTEGTSFTTIQPCLNYYAAQTDKMVFNKEYEGIITNGLVLNLDAGFIPSYQGSGTTWYDLGYSGFNGTLTNGATYSSLDGGSIVFDGVDDYISIPDINFTTSTIDIWVYINAYGAGGTVFVYQSSNGFEIWSDRAGLIRYNKNSFTILTSGTGFTLNSWNNIVATSDGTVNRLYLNNVNIGSTNGGIFDNTSGDIRISGYGGYLVNGRCSAIKMYNRSLTTSEITKNYNAGLSRFNTLNIVKNGLVLNLDSSNPVSYPTSGTTWTDLSGNGYHGTLINGPTFDSTSKSIVFDGTNDYVSCGTQIGNFGTSNFTINFLFKTGEQSAPSTFVAKSIGDGPTSDYGWLVNNGSDGTNLGFAIASADVNWGTNGSYVIQTSGATINNNTWQMATIVGDRSQSNVSIYLNGVLRSLKSYVTTTASFTSLGNVTNNKIFAIGSESDISSSPFPIEANIEALRIYDRSLSQSEVLQNYYQAPIVTSGLLMALDAGNLVSYSGAGTTWKDLTTNGKNGTLTNGPTYSSTNGGSIVFDGSDDYLITPTITNFRTISLWIKTSNTGGGWRYLIDARPGMGSGWYTGFESGGGVGSNWTSQYVNGYPTTVAFSNITLGTWCNLVVISDAPYTSTINFMSRFSNTEMLNGSIGNIMIYNKVLTADEVAQNFNAQKSRFGL